MSEKTKEEIRKELETERAEINRKKAENKKNREETKTKEADLKKKAKESGFSFSDRKPSRSEIFGEVLSSPFLSVPRTSDEINGEVIRVGLRYNVKGNESETETVRKLLFGFAFSYGILSVEKGKIVRKETERKEKKTA